MEDEESKKYQERVEPRNSVVPVNKEMIESAPDSPLIESNSEMSESALNSLLIEPEKEEFKLKSRRPFFYDYKV